jgi:hypothetical protein
LRVLQGWTIVSKIRIPAFRCQPEQVYLNMTEIAVPDAILLKTIPFYERPVYRFNYILKHRCISELQSLTSCNVNNQALGNDDHQCIDLCVRFTELLDGKHC